MRTLNILIVDDETFVVDWLCSILNAESDLSFRIFSAYGVAQASGILECNRIDILLSDIRMPDGSGLELAACARKLWHDCKILILTAYSEFDYVKKAIDLSIDGYILKTEKDENILGEIRRVVNELSVTLDERQQHLNTRLELDRYMLMYRDSVFFQWLCGSVLTDETWEKYSELLGLDAALQYYLILGRISRAENDEQKEWTALNIKLSCESIITESAAHFFTGIRGNDICLLLQPGPHHKENYQVLLENQMEIVSNACMKNYRVNISFVISDCILHPQSLSKYYWPMCAMLKTISSDGGSGLYRMPAQSVDFTGKDSFSSLIPAFQEALNQNDEDAYFRLETRVEQCFDPQTEITNSEFQNAYLSVALALADCFSHTNRDYLHEASLIYSPSAHSDVHSAFEYLRSLAVAFFAEQRTLQQDSRKKLIREIDDYIADNVHSDLTLADVSEHFHYNADYLSRLYAKATGQTLKKAITQQRLALIRNLMLDEQLSINNILERSGFKSRTYFNFFIKHTLGITPSQYRQELLNVEKQP